MSRLYGNYSGTANSDEISTPTTGVTSNNAQQQVGTIARPGSNSHTGWDIDELMWDAHGNLDPRGRLATDRPHVVKLYGAYQFGMGTQVGAFFYGGSGTPMSTQVVGQDQYAPFVNGRGDMGRTPVLTRTDLLVSHELSLADRKRLRFELNIQNLFNQKTATHIFNYLNKGAPAGGQTRRGRRDRLLERQPRGGLRLQRADPGDAGRGPGLRSALRDAGSLQPWNRRGSSA